MNTFHINHQLKMIMLVSFFLLFHLIPSNVFQVDLSECHSWSSKDSGINSNISSVTSSNQNFHQLQSTRTHSDDSYSFSTLSDLSYIPHEQTNLSNFDVTAWHSVPTSFECCHCQCHHHINNDLLGNEMNNNLYIPEYSRHKRTKNEFFSFIL